MRRETRPCRLSPSQISATRSVCIASAKEKGPLDEGMVEHAIREAGGGVSITGGEPTLRTDLVNLVGRLKKNDVVSKVGIQMNRT